MATTVLGLKTFTASDPVDYNEINDNYNKIDNGVKTALQGRAAYNLLDNSDFRNPVNQRGAKSYTGNVYTIDRWKLNANTLNVGSDGITIVAGDSSSSVLTQYTSGLRDGVYTQALNVNGTIYTRIIQLSGSTITTIDGSNAAYTGGYVSSVVSSSGYFSFQIRANAGYSITVRWAALYEGSYTADTLPAYQPKGYAAELAECQMYKRDMLVGNGYIIAIAFNNTQARLYIPYAMRKTPTVVFDARMKLKDLASGTVFDITDMSAANQTMNGFTLSITTDGLTTGNLYVLISGSGSYKIEYSCEL